MSELTAVLHLTHRAWQPGPFSFRPRPNCSLYLYEGDRAAWDAHRVGSRRGGHLATVLPQSPEALLAAGLLGSAVPDDLCGYPNLERLVTRRGSRVTVAPLSDDDAAAVYAWAAAVRSGVLLLLPGSAIDTGQVEQARAAGMNLELAVVPVGSAQ